MAEAFVIALDAGTTGTRALLIDPHGRVRARAYRRLQVAYPRPGWVEQEATEIWQQTQAVLAEVAAAVSGGQVLAIGLSNQRETTVLWHAGSGQPLHPAIVWQCRRTTGTCAGLKERGAESLVQSRTGLPIDPYFSATKMAWLLDTVPGARDMANSGQALLGTVDSWLLWKLSGGRGHVTDVTNASRTQLLDITRLCWDEELADLFAVPIRALPAVVPSGGLAGHTNAVAGVPDNLPILAVMGDSQAALFGEAAFLPGMAKATYGTGTSVLVNAGEQPPQCPPGMAATVAWQIDTRVIYALEGIVHTTGAAIQWLRDGLGLVSSPEEADQLAGAVTDTGGVWFVPAFVGLGTPWWDPNARGLLIGITGGTRREDVVQAVLNSIPLQVADVFTALGTGQWGRHPIACGGGGSQSAYLMQLQADLLQCPVWTCDNPEASSMGVATMAGLVEGLWSMDDLQHLHATTVSRRYIPKRSPEWAESYRQEWHRAVERSLQWVQEDA